MKNIYLFGFISIIMISCTRKYENSVSLYSEIEKPIEVEHENIEEEKDTCCFAKIKFDYYEFDAGDVPSGPDIEFEFPFTNIGEYPLVIRYCKSSSGCVLPICEDRFILPGERGVFKAKHWTKGVTGVTRKTLTMSANTEPERTVLHLTANIVATKE